MRNEKYYGNRVVIGTAKEIQAIWKSCTRHADKLAERHCMDTEFIPGVNEQPKFNMNSVYGIEFDEDSRFFYVIGTKRLAAMLVDDDFDQAKQRKLLLKSLMVEIKECEGWGLRICGDYATYEDRDGYTEMNLVTGKSRFLDRRPDHIWSDWR